MNRRTVGGLIMLSWLGSLGWLAVRNATTGTDRTRQLAAFRVGPAGGTYALRLDSVQVGMLSRTIDTLPSEVRVKEQWDIDLPASGTGPRRRIILQHWAWLSRDLHLLRFESRRSGNAVPLVVTGTVSGDTLLAWRAVRDGSVYVDSLFTNPLTPWTVTTTAPLHAAYGAPGRPGGEAPYTLFDPLSFRHAPATIRAERDSTWTPPDSAVFDSASRRWTVAHLDTLTAVRLGWADGDRRTSVWNDPAGMPVRMPGPFGLVAERSAFELVRQGYLSILTHDTASKR